MNGSEEVLLRLKLADQCMDSVDKSDPHTHLKVLYCLLRFLFMLYKEVTSMS